MYRTVLCLLLALTVAFSASAQSLPLTPRQFHEQELERIRAGLERRAASPLLSTQADYDAVYYDIRLDVRDFSGQTIIGSVGIVVRSLAADLDHLELDFCTSLTVDSVTMSSGPRTFTRNQGALSVALDRVYVNGEMVGATVYYHGSPCQTNSFGSFTYYTHGNNIPAISTLSEPMGARDWWPCKDNLSDKADSVRVAITCADTLVGSSNGILESIIPVPPNSRTYQFFERHPISTYLVCVAVSNYSTLNNWYVALNGDSMPVIHYVFPEMYSAAQASWDMLPSMISLYASKFGEYPFVDEKYGHTMFQWGGGMEHQTNTSLGWFIADGGHGYDWIVAHELSHQWWGDDVTCGTWPDIWLNEGFASYMEALWQEHLGGPAALQSWQENANGVTDPSGPVYNPSDLFNSNTVYNKGSWVLHMLRGVVRNDSAFFAAMQSFRALHAYGNATTAQFLGDMSNALGFPVDPYLHAYLYRMNRPHFQVSFGTGAVDGQLQTVVRIRQTQSVADTTFRTRLDLQFSDATHTLTVPVENATRDARYYINPTFVPTQLVLDPDDWVLKAVENAPMTLTILNSKLDSAQQGTSYRDSLVAIGGTPPYSWLVIGQPLPAGLSLASDGVITGTPSVAGTFPVTFVVQDNAAHADTAVLSLYISPASLSGINVFFVPDTSYGAVGDTITLSCQIGPTDPMRSFTIYMTYDTNRIDLAAPPVAGPVIAGHTGLQFNYFDHAPFLPNVLEVTATIFGTDFWQGPGELFTMRLILRSCGDETVVAPYPPFFISADDTYPSVTYHPALVRICSVVPQPANSLTIIPIDPLSMLLRWSPVTQDTSGNPLPAPPTYTIVRQQVLPTLDPPVNIATVPDTFFVNPQGSGAEYIYYIVTQTVP